MDTTEDVWDDYYNYLRRVTGKNACIQNCSKRGCQRGASCGFSHTDPRNCEAKPKNSCPPGVGPKHHPGSKVPIGIANQSRQGPPPAPSVPALQGQANAMAPAQNQGVIVGYVPNQQQGTQMAQFGQQGNQFGTGQTPANSPVIGPQAPTCLQSNGAIFGLDAHDLGTSAKLPAVMFNGRGFPVGTVLKNIPSPQVVIPWSGCTDYKPYSLSIPGFMMGLLHVPADNALVDFKSSVSSDGTFVGQRPYATKYQLTLIPKVAPGLQDILDKVLFLDYVNSAIAKEALPEPGQNLAVLGANVDTELQLDQYKDKLPKFLEMAAQGLKDIPSFFEAMKGTKEEMLVKPELSMMKSDILEMRHEMQESRIATSHAIQGMAQVCSQMSTLMATHLSGGLAGTNPMGGGQFVQGTAHGDVQFGNGGNGGFGNSAGGPNALQSGNMFPGSHNVGILGQNTTLGEVPGPADGQQVNRAYLKGGHLYHLNPNNPANKDPNRSNQFNNNQFANQNKQNDGKQVFNPLAGGMGGAKRARQDLPGVFDEDLIADQNKTYMFRNHGSIYKQFMVMVQQAWQEAWSNGFKIAHTSLTLKLDQWDSYAQHLKDIIKVQLQGSQKLLLSSRVKNALVNLGACSARGGFGALLERIGDTVDGLLDDESASMYALKEVLMETMVWTTNFENPNTTVDKVIELLQVRKDTRAANDTRSDEQIQAQRRAEAVACIAIFHLKDKLLDRPNVSGATGINTVGTAENSAANFAFSQSLNQGNQGNPMDATSGSLFPKASPGLIPDGVTPNRKTGLLPGGMSASTKASSVDGAPVFPFPGNAPSPTQLAANAARFARNPAYGPNGQVGGSSSSTARFPPPAAGSNGGFQSCYSGMFGDINFNRQNIAPVEEDEDDGGEISEANFSEEF